MSDENSVWGFMTTAYPKTKFDFTWEDNLSLSDVHMISVTCRQTPLFLDRPYLVAHQMVTKTLWDDRSAKNRLMVIMVDRLMEAEGYGPREP